MYVMGVALFALGLAGWLGVSLLLWQSWRMHTTPVAATPTIALTAVVFVLSTALVSIDRLAVVQSAPTTNASVGPTAGQLVYRVYGGTDAEPFGSSWTPVDPRTHGPDRFRVVAGLPDMVNAGTELIFGYLDSPSAVTRIRAALPIAAGARAHCSYPGGLIEYSIPNARAHVRDVQTVELEPRFGDKPARACDV